MISFESKAQRNNYIIPNLMSLLTTVSTQQRDKEDTAKGAVRETSK
jgi:hypothetical protein